MVCAAPGSKECIKTTPATQSWSGIYTITANHPPSQFACPTHPVIVGQARGNKKEKEMENWNVVSMKPELNATEELTDERNSLVMVTGDDSRIIADFYSEEDATRSANCVNACAGIPDAELPNVRKALCASELLNHGWYKPENIPSNFKDFGGSFQDYLVGMANASIDSGRTFGELDQLIRECR